SREIPTLVAAQAAVQALACRVAAQAHGGRFGPLDGVGFPALRELDEQLEQARLVEIPALAALTRRPRVEIDAALEQRRAGDEQPRDARLLVPQIARAEQALAARVERQYRLARACDEEPTVLREGPHAGLDQPG